MDHVDGRTYLSGAVRREGCVFGKQCRQCGSIRGTRGLEKSDDQATVRFAVDLEPRAIRTNPLSGAVQELTTRGFVCSLTRSWERFTARP
jgi:hypothetical protein